MSEAVLEKIKRKQWQEELDKIESSRKRIEKTFQSQLKILDQREHEIQKGLKALG